MKVRIIRTDNKVPSLQEDPEHRLLRVRFGHEPQDPGPGHPGVGAEGGRHCVGNLDRLRREANLCHLERGWIRRHPRSGLRHCQRAPHRPSSEKHIVLTVGDGDAFGIGLTHLIHAARSNADMT